MITLNWELRGGPKIKITIISLQSNAMIVNSQNEDHEEEQDFDKTKINSNIIHNRFHIDPMVP